MRALWNAGGDRPEPGPISWRRVRPHDAANRFPILIEYLVVVCELAAAEVGRSEGEHGRTLALFRTGPCCGERGNGHLVEITLQLISMAFEVGRDDQDHLIKQNLAADRRAGGKFRLEKWLEAHDCPGCAKAYGCLSKLLAGIFGIGGRTLALNDIGCRQAAWVIDGRTGCVGLGVSLCANEQCCDA